MVPSHPQDMGESLSITLSIRGRLLKSRTSGLYLALDAAAVVGLVLSIVHAAQLAGTPDIDLLEYSDMRMLQTDSAR